MLFYFFFFFPFCILTHATTIYARLQRQTKDFMGHTQDLSPLTFSFIPVWSKKGLEHICMMVSHPAWSLFCHYSGNKQSCQSGTLFRVHLKMCKQQQVEKLPSALIYQRDRMGDALFISVSNMHFMTFSWCFYAYYDQFGFFYQIKKS